MEQTSETSDNVTDSSSNTPQRESPQLQSMLLLHDEINSFNSTTCPSTPERNSNINTNQKLKEKIHQLPCFALNLLQENGSIQSKCKDNSFFLLKLQKIEIVDDYKEKLEAGKQSLGNFLMQEIGSIPDMNFWYQRYYYYFRFDEGIQMDYESWYSVTPEPIAKYIATLTKDKIIIDGFCGSGGNVIQFSKYGKKVYAIDIEENKIKICKNNCKVYNCEDNIEFILADFLTMKSKIKGDYVFLSPPWGGLKYKNTDIYSIKKLMTPNIYDIIRISLSIASKILFYVPRNLDLDELCAIVSEVKNEIVPSSGNELFFDIRILKSNRKVKALLIIFGEEPIDSITEKDVQEYLISHYNFITFDNLKFIINIAKIIGYKMFFKKESEYKGGLSFGNNINFLLRYFMLNVLTDNQKLMLTARIFLNFQKPKQRLKLEIKKNNELIKPFFPKSFSFNHNADK